MRQRKATISDEAEKLTQFNYEKNELLRVIQKHVRKTLVGKAAFKQASKDMVVVLGVFAVIDQMFAHFQYLKKYKYDNKMKILSSLYIINKIQLSLEHKGHKRTERTLVDVRK